MATLTYNKEAEIIQAYLDDPLNIVSLYFEGMVSQIKLPELQLYKANVFDTEPYFCI